MRGPTEDLKNEHEVILRMLDLLTKASDRLQKGEDVDPKLFEDAIDFLRNFVDKCHHTKEEQHLFVEMIAHGVSGEVGPISVMMREHQDARAHVKKLAGLSKKKLSPTTKKAIAKTAKAYVDVMSKHIQKENDVLFPMADHLLPPEDQRKLEEAFDEVEEKVMGPNVHDKYLRMIDEWEERYS